MNNHVQHVIANIYCECKGIVGEAYTLEQRVNKEFHIRI